MQDVSLPAIFRAFATIGCTAFGGAWAALPRVEKELISKRGWLTQDELDELMAVAALIPGPTFAVMAGLVGYRLRGMTGCAVGILGLVGPSASLVLAAAALASPDLLSGPLREVQRSVAVAVVGILAGASWRVYQNRTRKASRSAALRGTVVTLLVISGLLAELPPLPVVLGGLAAGAWLMREGGAHA